MAAALRTSKYNWGYQTAPQKYSLKGILIFLNFFILYINLQADCLFVVFFLLGFIDKKTYISQGKAVGGSSAIDFMIYARGKKEDYDKWGTDSPGWTYDDILPFFKKSENVNFPNADTNFHGTTGELNVEYSRAFDEIGKAFIEGNAEIGRNTSDYNARSKIGVSRLQLIQQNGKRQSGAKAFISPTSERPNLYIFSNTLTTKLLIDSETKEVYGVQYLKNGTLHYANASKEVILSREAINTPQTLMLSGIGPRLHLCDLGIPVVKDLPVGNNLRGKLAYSFNTFQINYTFEEPEPAKQVEDYLIDGSGPLTTPLGFQAIAYSKVNDGLLDLIDIVPWPQKDPEVPNVEYLFRANKAPNETYEFYKNLMGYTQETYDHVIKPTLGLSQWAIDIIPLNLKSTGKVRLKSASYLDFPIIDPNYFSDARDLKLLVEAIKDAIKIGNTKAMQKYKSTLVKVRHPACKLYWWGTDMFWQCMALTLSNSISEFTGTAKMGPQSDYTSVVDNNLRVHGIKNLRVADLSVIPHSISGHINAVSYMIGEKASDLIKKTYLNNSV